MNNTCKMDSVFYLANVTNIPIFDVGRRVSSNANGLRAIAGHVITTQFHAIREQLHAIPIGKPNLMLTVQCA